MTDPDDYDDDLEFGNCGNIGCNDGWVADCIDGFCVNAEDGCELCLMRCDWCNPRLASVDTHAERCDVKQAQPARVGSAVPEGQTPKGNRR